MKIFLIFFLILNSLYSYGYRECVNFCVYMGTEWTKNTEPYKQYPDYTKSFYTQICQEYYLYEDNLNNCNLSRVILGDYILYKTYNGKIEGIKRDRSDFLKIRKK